MGFRALRGLVRGVRVRLGDMATQKPSETRYARVGDASVAYRTLGDGPLDLLYFWGLPSHVELQWDLPMTTAPFLRLASVGRLIIFDRRGTGASDPVSPSALPSWEDWTEDVSTVLDAVNCKQAVIFAEADAGPIGILFAAVHPERVSALILAETSARALVDEDYSIGLPQENIDAIVDIIGSLWGTPELLSVTSGEMSEEPEISEWVTRVQRACVTPSMAGTQFRYILNTLDVRQALGLVQAPTLILHHAENPLIPITHGRYLQDHIKDSTLVELPGVDVGLAPTNHELWTDEVVEFLTGTRPPLHIDRILTTVLFTDIVGSTDHLVSVGDQRWRSLLDRHDRAVREQLRIYRGQEIKTTGDGFVATFDGPARAIQCAGAVIEANRRIGLEIRAGLHTGECELRGDDLAGLAVHVAARICGLAGPGQVLVSRTVKDLVAGSGLDFSEVGEHPLKGVPGAWTLFAVSG
jgi:class 3 adenylate cyclase/pimeloyl-ACP methyl ester carboxylesterase